MAGWSIKSSAEEIIVTRRDKIIENLAKFSSRPLSEVVREVHLVPQNLTEGLSVHLQDAGNKRNRQKGENARQHKQPPRSLGNEDTKAKGYSSAAAAQYHRQGGRS